MPVCAQMNPASPAFQRIFNNAFAFAAFKSTEPWLQVGVITGQVDAVWGPHVLPVHKQQPHQTRWHSIVSCTASSRSQTCRLRQVKLTGTCACLPPSMHMHITGVHHTGHACCHEGGRPPAATVEGEHATAQDCSGSQAPVRKHTLAPGTLLLPAQFHSLHLGMSGNQRGAHAGHACPCPVSPSIP
jgi:hypothetical protein